MTTSPSTSKFDSSQPATTDLLSRIANQLFKGDGDMPSAEPAAGGAGASAGRAGRPAWESTVVNPLKIPQPPTRGAPTTMSAMSSPAEVEMASGSAAAAPAFYFLEYNVASPAPQSLPSQPRTLPGGAIAVPPFNLQQVLRDFPILSQTVNGHRLVWLDNAATTQKPRQVIDRLREFYEQENSNIHRAAHTLAARATDAYEGARAKIQRFLGAAASEEIVYVRGATEAINLVAQSWGRAHIGAGDEILVSHLEHHANIVPWQQLCSQVRARLRVIPVDDSGQILMEEYGKLLSARTKLVSFCHVSNALGTVTPVQHMVEMAHRSGAKVLVDGAQSVSHLPIDLQRLGCDWFVLSGHKVFAPTGVGVLYGRRDVLAESPPWQGGGNMIADVTFDHTTYQEAPARFEAGTGTIADAVALGAAVDYLSHIGMANIARYEHQLLEYATQQMQRVPGLRLIGTAPDKASVLSFVLEGWNNAEVGRELDRKGIAVRSGHHCAQPILRRFGLESSVRPSLAFYNTCEDIDLLTRSLHQLSRLKRGRNA